MSGIKVVTESNRNPVDGLMLDLGHFTCGHSRLGEIPDERDFFAEPLAKTNVLKIEAEGLEIGAKNRRLDSYFITFPLFRGATSYKGKPWKLKATTTPEEIQQVLGAPYWIDRSDGEMILFYEYKQGTVELQFEFPKQKGLGFITLMRDGVLSQVENRWAYGVTVPWPPGE